MSPRCAGRPLPAMHPALPADRAATAAPPPATVGWPDAAREAAFWRWFTPLAQAEGLDAATLAPASADASFRRYLRVQAADGSSRIVMDAPPPQEDVRPFVDVARRIQARMARSGSLVSCLGPLPRPR